MKTANVKQWLLLSALIVVLVPGVALADVNDWFYAMPITFDGYTGSGPLTNFPALVVFSNNIAGSGFDYATMGTSTGADLRFTDSTGTTLLYHEIERWNTNGASHVWVQIPELTDSTVIQARWGDPDGTTPSYSLDGSVWSEGYAGAWHLHTTSDSATNAHHATTVGSVAAGAEGMVNGAYTFTGGHLNVAADPLLTFSNAITLEGWIKLNSLPATSSQWRTLGGQWVPASGNRAFMLTMRGADDHPGRFSWWISNNGSASSSIGANAVAATGVWYHVAGTFSGSTARLYVNGVQQSQTASVSGIHSTQQDFEIGTFDNRDNYMDGIIDSVRLSRVARSANWLAASWKNQGDNTAFNTYGGVRPIEAPWANNTGATGISSSSAWLNGELLDEGESAATVRFHWGTSDGGTGTWDETLNRGETAVGSFSNAVSLSGNTLYYYRISASNTAGVAWTPASTFITGEVTVHAAQDALMWSQTTGTFTLTRPAALTNAALTVGYTIGGDAVPGTHYEALSGEATFAAGATTTTIDIVPLPTDPKDLTEREVVITLNGAGAVPGSPASAAVTIRNDILGDWTHYMELSFDGYAGSTALTNFPALVVFSNNVAGSGFDYATLGTSTGADLRFTDSSGTTLLYHEIERWDPDGASHVWVQIPELTDSTGIQARWGDPDGTTLPYSQDGSVWSEGYAGVWHLHTISDSGTNAHHATTVGSVTAGAEGLVNGAYAFTGGHLNVAADPLLTFSNAITLEGWINLNSLPSGTGWRTLASQWFPTGSSRAFMLTVRGTTTYPGHFSWWISPDGSANTTIGANAAAATGVWYHVSGTFDGSTSRLYIDGQQQTQTASVAGIRTTQSPFQIGTFDSESGRMDGILDSVRLSRVARSADWIAASHTNQRTPETFISPARVKTKFPAGTMIIIK